MTSEYHSRRTPPKSDPSSPTNATCHARLSTQRALSPILAIAKVVIRKHKIGPCEVRPVLPDERHLFLVIHSGFVEAAGEVPRGEKMLCSGTDPESYITRKSTFRKRHRAASRGAVPQTDYCQVLPHPGPK